MIQAWKSALRDARKKDQDRVAEMKEMFEVWKEKYNKKYESEEEAEKFEIWKNALKEVGDFLIWSIFTYPPFAKKGEIRYQVHSSHMLNH